MHMGQAFHSCRILRPLALFLLFIAHQVRLLGQIMKKNLLILAPLSMLALAACNKSEAPAQGEEAAEVVAAPVELPPSITASGTYRCADNTIIYVDFFGDNVAAAIRVEKETALPIRVEAPKAEAAAEGEEAVAPTGPMASADGETTLSGSGKSINVKLAGKGAQTCKS